MARRATTLSDDETEEAIAAAEAEGVAVCDAGATEEGGGVTSMPAPSPMSEAVAAEAALLAREPRAEELAALSKLNELDIELFAVVNGLFTEQLAQARALPGSEGHAARRALDAAAEDRLPLCPSLL